MNKSVFILGVVALLSAVSGFCFLQSSGPTAEEVRLKRANTELTTKQVASEARIQSLTDELHELKRETTALRQSTAAQ